MYLGIDIGSVSIKYAIIDDKSRVTEQDYFRTHGDVINALRNLLKEIKSKKVEGISITGSGRKFIKALVSADVDVDEITAHRTAVKNMYPNVRTIFEIGGQDSKLIYFTENTIGFEMNNVCAAGTGSFLDQQAARLDISIKEFFELGLTTEESHKIASKCTVFAETDMIHAQQSGIPINKVIRGVHRGMINNYYSQLCLGKKLQGEFLFEGGTSENPLLVQEFVKRLQEEKLIESSSKLIVPHPHNKVMGAIGAAMICKSQNINNKREIPQINDFEFLESTECFACPNRCGANITKIKVNGDILTIGRPCQE